jgi:hypothetical protein
MIIIKLQYCEKHNFVIYQIFFGGEIIYFLLV